MRSILYLDKENFLSLVHSTKDVYYNDCHRMLKNHIDVQCNFNKQDLDDISDDDKDLVLQWMKKMTDGARSEWYFNNSEKIFPIRPLKSNVHKTFSQVQLSSIYLLNDGKTQCLRNYGSLLWGEIGLETTVLSKLFFKDYQFDKTIALPNMKNWDELGENLLPCTDIVVVDRYVFSYPELYEFNIYPLLEKLCQHANNCQINIVFVTFKEIYINKTIPSFTPKFQKIKQEIQKKIRQISKIPPKVTFVTSSSELFEEHDRTIITNYQYIHCGDSLTIFDSNGKVITKGNTIDIKSVAREYELRTTVLEKIQNFIDTVLGTRNNDLIIGDKECNFLKLSQP